MFILKNRTIGSITAANNVTLTADDEINLLAAVLSACPLQIYNWFQAHFLIKLGLKCQEYPSI